MFRQLFILSIFSLLMYSCTQEKEKQKKEISQILMQELEISQQEGDTLAYQKKRKEINDVIRTKNDKKLELYVETHDAIKRMNQGEIDIAINELKHVYQKALDQDEKFTTYSTASTLGNATYFKGNIIGALSYWRNAADIAEKNNLQKYIAPTYGNIAVGYLELGYYHSASRYFIKTKKQLQKLGIRDENYWTNQINIANVYLKMNLPQNAIDNLKIIDKKDSKKVQYLYYANMASAYSKLGKKKETILYLDSTRLLLPYNQAYRLAILEEEFESYSKFDLKDKIETTFNFYLSDTTEKSIALKVAFNNAYFAVNQRYFDDLNTIINWQKTIDSTDYITNNIYYSFLSDAYENLGNYKMHSYYLKRCQYYQNIVIDEKIKNQFEDNLLSQKNEQILDKNKILVLRNKTKQAQLDKSILLVVFTITLLILLLLVIMLLIYSTKKTKKFKEQELQFAQSEIAKSNLLSKQLSEKIDLQNEKLNNTILLVNKLSILKKQFDDFFEKVNLQDGDNDFKNLIKGAKMDFKSFFSIYNDLTVQASTLDEFHEQIKHFAIKYQILTKKELQIVQLIINKYTTKEIALLLSRSTKNIEFSRGEIRKKLNIPTEISLVEFLENN
jgi:DNA-binding CsgD family transcriptional regulator